MENAKRLDAILRELLSASRELRMASEAGLAEEVRTLLRRRAGLLDGISHKIDPGDRAARALLDELISEDRKTLRSVEQWRERAGAELQSIADSQTALAGYRPPRGGRGMLFKTEL